MERIRDSSNWNRGRKELTMGPKGVIEREKRQKEKEGKIYKGETGTRTDAEQKSKEIRWMIRKYRCIGACH